MAVPRLTRTVRFALAAAAVGCLAIPATGLGAVAAVEDDRIINVNPDDVPQRVALIKATKAKVSMVDIFWSDVAPTKPKTPTNHLDPAYDWSLIDAMVIEMKRANIVPIASVYSTPTWANGNRQAPCLNNLSPCQRSAYNPFAPLKPADFGNFLQAAATRYNGKQTIEYQGQQVKLPKVSHWEMFNEPNLKSFFRKGNGSNVAWYGTLVRAAYPRIKAANPKAIVIAGATGPRSSTGGGNIGARDWINGLVSQKSTRFDAYSQHIYPAAAPNTVTKAFPSWSSLPEIFSMIDKKKKGMPVYITEASYTTAKTPFRNVSVTPAQQRTYLNQIFNLPTVKSSRVPVVMWFNLQDNPFWPGGLMRENLSKKPSYAAFQKFAAKPFTSAQRSQLVR